MTFSQKKLGLPVSTGMAALLLVIAGCLPQHGPRPSPKQVPDGDAPLSSTMTIPSGLHEHTAIFYVPPPEGDATAFVTTLMRAPQLKMTLVLPPRYFEPVLHREQLAGFRLLHSSGQIEIALTLENEPILPLLANFQQAFNGSSPWNFNFAWIDDVTAQIARGSGQHQKKWGKRPSGIYPPYLSLSEPVVKVFPRFWLSYTLAKPQEEWGIKMAGNTTILVPPLPPVSTFAEGSTEWADELAKWALENPFTLIDGSLWTRPESEGAFLHALVKAIRLKPETFQTHLGEELQAYVHESHLLDSKMNPFANDYSAWVKTPQQRVAWQALAEARKVLESYKTSGRAVLGRLDAAQAEMCVAESGTFLLGLGQSQVSMPINEKNFTATVANIYRLTNNPVPDHLNRLFTGAGKKFQVSIDRNEASDVPFFDQSEKSLTWNDPLGDDVGSGSFRYPYGTYPAGTFDLKRFSVSKTNEYVTFSVGLNGPLPSEQAVQILPIADIYIDVNRLAGAGSQEPLRQRGSILIDKDAAWEYALVLGQTTAMLYQSAPGKEPRKLGTFKPTKSPSIKTYTVSVPLDMLRGNPNEWRMSVALGGMEQQKGSEEILPIAIMSPVGPKNFGGAISGRSAPHFIDLLEPTADGQKDRMKVYESGRKVILPYVEAE